MTGVGKFLKEKNANIKVRDDRVLDSNIRKF